MFKNPRNKTTFLHLARQVYPENISSFYKTYLDVCKDPHSYLFLDFMQSIYKLLRFRTKIYPGEDTDFLLLLKLMTWLKSQLHFLHVLKNAKPQARCTVLTSADDNPITAMVECAMNTLNGNHKLFKGDKNKLSKYKNRLRASVNPKISFKSKRKRNSERRVKIPLLTSILSDVVGTQISGNN